jgi:hypothetical protein
MKQLINNKSYRSHIVTAIIIQTAVFLLLFFAIQQAIANQTIVIVILLSVVYLVSVFAILSRKYTQSISVTDRYFSIEYYHLLTKKLFKHETENVRLKITKQGKFRPAKIYYDLEIFSNGKRVFVVHSTDGFDKSEFESLMSPGAGLPKGDRCQQSSVGL